LRFYGSNASPDLLYLKPGLVARLGFDVYILDANINSKIIVSQCFHHNIFLIDIFTINDEVFEI
jgi:hypothetical protein